MAVDAPKKLSYVFSVLCRIVLSEDERVFECDPSSGLFRMLSAGWDEHVQRVGLSGRHQSFAGFLRGCME